MLFPLYLTRPDWAQAIHWWPMALWTPVALLPFFSLRFRRLIRPFLLALVVCAASLHVVREPSARVLWPVLPKDSYAFRVVSLNCAAGSVEAAKEAFRKDADIVLLQEVGNKEEFVAAAAKAGYDHVSWSVDDAIMSPYPITDTANAMDFAAGTVTISTAKVRVVSLRLYPPMFRLDLWNPDCWRSYARDTTERRARVKAILAEARVSGPCIVGGDFNATNPRIVTDVAPALTEAGRTAESGWRGTGTNDFPWVWVDQIWGSPDVHWAQAFVRKTHNSDHRIVIADFWLPDLIAPW